MLFIKNTLPLHIFVLIQMYAKGVRNLLAERHTGRSRISVNSCKVVNLLGRPHRVAPTGNCRQCVCRGDDPIASFNALNCLFNSHGTIHEITDFNSCRKAIHHIVTFCTLSLCNPQSALRSFPHRSCCCSPKAHNCASRPICSCNNGCDTTFSFCHAGL